MLLCIVNFDDLDFLVVELGVWLIMVLSGWVLLGDVDLVILLGSKLMCGDLVFLWVQGWDIDFVVYVWCGGYVLGICGGYQMLGCYIYDLDGYDGVLGSDLGLGFLQIDMYMVVEKCLICIYGQVLGYLVQGYEIYMGCSYGFDSQCFFVNIFELDGVISVDGWIMGIYLYGIFIDNGFCVVWLVWLGGLFILDYVVGVEVVLDWLVRYLEIYLDIDCIFGLVC